MLRRLFGREHYVVTGVTLINAARRKKCGFTVKTRVRMRTVGNGPDKPVETNATPEGREKNRRTDIKVYPNPGVAQ